MRRVTGVKKKEDVTQTCQWPLRIPNQNSRIPILDCPQVSFSEVREKEPCGASRIGISGILIISGFRRGHVCGNQLYQRVIKTRQTDGHWQRFVGPLWKKWDSSSGLPGIRVMIMITPL